jgi:hypothetical protein
MELLMDGCTSTNAAVEWLVECLITDLQGRQA